jgi:phosphoribosylformylglycinamidine synthase
VDLAAELRLQRFLLAAAERGWLASAHDCADGGLAVALAECCIGGPYSAATLGALVQLDTSETLSREALLYGEDAGRVIISCDSRSTQPLRALAAEHGVAFHAMGMTCEVGDNLEIRVGNLGTSFEWPTPDLRRIYFDAIPRRMRTDG